MKARELLSIPALLLALQANAACEPPPVSAMPAVPDGDTATAETMFAAQEQVETYVATIETYLDCRGYRLSVMVHDGLVLRARKIADDYNRELRKFRVKQSEIAGY